MHVAVSYAYHKLWIWSDKGFPLLYHEFVLYLHFKYFLIYYISSLYVLRRFILKLIPFLFKLQLCLCWM
jgi:hypothetical protein